MNIDIKKFKDKLLYEGLDLPGNQDKLDVAEPKGKLTAADFNKLRSMKKEGGDHEVSMANNSIETIIKAAMQLKAQLGNNEKDIPAWIQDHISKAENYITQAAQNYHEYGDEEIEDMPIDGSLD